MKKMKKFYYGERTTVEGSVNERSNKVTHVYQVGKSPGRYGLPIYASEIVPKEELATIGLGGYNKKGDITENMIRAEHGLNPRGAYLKGS